MSGFQLTASLASSLAWPVLAAAVLTFLWIKRAAVTQLARDSSVGRGRMIRRLKAGPFELEWDQLVEETTSRVRKLSRESQPPPYFRHLRETARRNPAIAVQTAFSEVEQSLRKLVPEYPYTGFERLAAIAQEKGLIPEQVRVALDNLVALRNTAAHRVGEADITIDQAYEYLDLAEYIMTLMPPNSDADKLERGVGRAGL